MNENSTSSTTSGGIGLLLFFFALGFFIYGGLSGGLGFILLFQAYTLSLLILVIPIIGLIGYFFIIQFLVKPAVFNITPLYATPMSSVLFWAMFVVAVIFTVIYLVRIGVVLHE